MIRSYILLYCWYDIRLIDRLKSVINNNTDKSAKRYYGHHTPIQ